MTSAVLALPVEWAGNPVPITIYFNDTSFSLFESSTVSPALFREPLQNVLLVIQEQFTLSNDIELTFKDLDLTFSSNSLGSLNLSLSHICSLCSSVVPELVRVEATVVETNRNFLSRYNFLLSQCPSTEPGTTNTSIVYDGQEEEIDLGSDSDDESAHQAPVAPMEDIDLGTTDSDAHATIVESEVTEPILEDVDLGVDAFTGEISLEYPPNDTENQGEFNGVEDHGSLPVASLPSTDEIALQVEAQDRVVNDVEGADVGDIDTTAYTELPIQIDDDQPNEFEIEDATENPALTEEFTIDVDPTGETFPTDTCPTGDYVEESDACSAGDGALDLEVLDTSSGERFLEAFIDSELAIPSDQGDDYTMDEIGSRKRTIEEDAFDDGPLSKRQKLTHGDVLLV